MNAKIKGKQICESSHLPYLDNIRWTVVAMVLLFHVFWFYSITFTPQPKWIANSQPQDIVVMLFNPWFMSLLFVVSGICAYLYLQHHSDKEFFKARSLKLLVPSTLGLILYHWISGVFNMKYICHRFGLSDFTLGMSAREFLPLLLEESINILWFLVDLYVFSLILIGLRRIYKDNLNAFFEKHRCHGIVIFCCSLVLLYLVGLIDIPNYIDILITLRPLYYLTAFLLGYYVFSVQSVMRVISNDRWIFASISLIIILCMIFTGCWKVTVKPEIISSVPYILYGWTMVLACLGLYCTYFNYSNAITRYMSRNSFGLYIVHYAIITSFGYWLAVHSSLPQWAIYTLLIAIVFVLTPIIYQLLYCVPFVRFCLFGKTSQQPINILNH